MKSNKKLALILAKYYKSIYHMPQEQAEKMAVLEILKRIEEGKAKAAYYSQPQVFLEEIK